MLIMIQAAYLVPIVSMLLTDCPPAGGPHDGNAPSPLALIFAPTRELVEQIYWETLKFANGLFKFITVYHKFANFVAQK